jgi:FtsH-binding integral membrane protein
MKKRSGPFATAYRILFALPFAGAGVLAFLQGLRAGAASGAIFGLVFVAVGLWQVWLAIRDWRSAESQALVGASASLADVVPPAVLDYRTAASRPRSAGELYGPILASAPLPRLTSTPGRVLARALPKPSVKEGVWLAVFAVFWNGMTLPFLAVAIASRSMGMLTFISLFVIAGVIVAVAATKKLLGRTKLPVVEVSDEPAFVGDEVSFHVEQRGPARVNRLQVDLLCRESATYTIGTDTRTEVRDVFERALVDETMLTIARGERSSHQVRAVLPSNLPASFASKNNAIRWLVRVRADIAGWPDYDEVFELRALPKVGP